MRGLRSTLLALAMLLSAYAQAAETRIALVIGNSGYTSGPLINPANDAKLMGDTLTSLGFEVIARRDANQAAMKRAIQEFGARLEKAGPSAVGLFYYAGHGVQLNGRNYLIPTGANIEREADMEIEAVSADWVMEQMRYARNRLNLVILDACRNNPFTRSMRSADRGLAKMDAPAGTLIAYSTAPGDVAADGKGRNSPYTEALAQAMREVRQPVEQVFKRARVAVMSATANKQTPWESSSLTGDFYFTGAGTVAAVVPSVAPPVVLPSVAPQVADRRDDDVCRRVVGRWKATGFEGEIAIEADQTVMWWKNSGDKLASVTGTWVCQSAKDRRFVFTWGHGSIDTLTLSRDDRSLTGKNQFNLPIVETRVR